MQRLCTMKTPDLLRKSEEMRIILSCAGFFGILRKKAHMKAHSAEQ
jgi:hypothetical protein